MNPRPPVRAGGFYTDPKPYRRRSGTRWWSRRWSVEFWADDGDHDFRRYFTRRAAVRFAEAHMGERWKARIVSGGPCAPFPAGRVDWFVLGDPVVAHQRETETPRGGISYVDPPDSVPFRLVEVRDPSDRAGIERDVLMTGESFVLQPPECELCPLPRGHAGRCDEGEPS